MPWTAPSVMACVRSISSGNNNQRSRAKGNCEIEQSRNRTIPAFQSRNRKLNPFNLNFLISGLKCRKRSISRLFDFTIPPTSPQ
jgi:hypothetical protein